VVGLVRTAEDRMKATGARQVTVWIVEDFTCPRCGGLLATDGNAVWCVNVERIDCRYGQEDGKPEVMLRSFLSRQGVRR